MSTIADNIKIMPITISKIVSLLSIVLILMLIKCLLVLYTQQSDTYSLFALHNQP